MDIKNKALKYFDEIYKKYFFSYKIELENIRNQIIEDINYMSSKLEDFNLNGINAIIFYRLTRSGLKDIKCDNITDIVFRLKNESMLYTTSYLSPFAIVECPIIIGENVFIDKNYQIGKNVVIENNVQLIDKNIYNIDNKYNTIGNEVCIENNVKIYNSNIGKFSLIKENCVIREDISDGSVVEVISELQIKNSKIKSHIPSQILSVYGVVPKYKNSFVLYGEGIYNPKVKLIVQKHSPELEIMYWDKNKIIVKIEYFELSKNEKSKLVLFSNGQRIVINNSTGLQKVLKNLQK